MRTNHLPGAGQKRFWQKKWPREALFNGPPIIVAGSAAVKSWRDPQFDQWMFGLATAACVWLVLSAIVRIVIARAEDQKDGPDVVHEGLYAAVSAVHTLLSEWCTKRRCGADIRATFHRVVPPIHEPQEIEQIINYAGANGEGVGRTFSIHTGITGRAIRSKKPLVMSSQDGTEEQLRTELVREWGYTEAEARKLGPGRYSAMAVPVLDRSGQHPIGVIYFDSSDRALFERDDVVEIVGAGAKAISDFVTKRY
ncbi:GAF domain-containing protein [Achromobacter pulmonis]|uniref:GAF domain-containing protein n=1 Tax=Achromobacter pulmonis TaxID=1389932 RepID=UPI00215A0234|nr:GAF domain-containing protein [Achromobacter pulmonis]